LKNECCRDVNSQNKSLLLILQNVDELTSEQQSEDYCYNQLFEKYCQSMMTLKRRMTLS